MRVNGTPFEEGKCTLDDDDLYVDITDKPYQVNPKSNSDDLNPIVITNTFKGSTDCTVYKLWKDDSNAENTRTDLYINLYRHSLNPTASANDTKIGMDYLWVRQPHDTINHWSYTYSPLAKYDGDGYRYEYYVKELTSNLKKNSYVTYYDNVKHTTAVGSNNKSYISNDSVFVVGKDDITNGNFTLTISDMDARDVNYLTDKQNPDANVYEYRITDRKGKPISETEAVLTVTADENDNSKVVLTVTKTDGHDTDLVFRLQRKIRGDKYRDLPDFYQTGTNTDLTAYDGKETDNLNGRAYNYGTITNRLEGKVEIQGIKIWQNIADSLQNYNYPIADVFLYANIKSHAQRGDYNADKTVYVRDETDHTQTKDFVSGGYAIVEGVPSNKVDTKNALGELMNMLQITGGMTTFNFSAQREINKDDSGNVQYIGDTDYVQFKNDSILLEKYDENGALINYSLKERAINGYTYRISDDKIINEYNGGEKVQVKVTKYWKNMTASSVYPTIKLTLHQCYVGKTSEESNTIGLMEYQCFEKVIRNNEWNNGSSSMTYYTFGAAGGKETLYQYSPTGEEFFYYVTEELIGTGKTTLPAETGDVIFTKTYILNENGKPAVASHASFDLVHGKTFSVSSGTVTVPLTDDMKGKTLSLMVQGLPEKSGSKPYSYTVSEQNGTPVYSILNGCKNGKPTVDLIFTTQIPKGFSGDSVTFTIQRKTNGGSTENVSDVFALLPVDVFESEDKFYGLGFQTSIDEAKEKSSSSDKKTGLITLPSDVTDQKWKIGGLPQSDIDLHRYTYQIVKCDESGAEHSSESVTVTQTNAPDNTCFLFFDKAQSGDRFKVYRTKTVDGSAVKELVLQKADGKPLWAVPSSEYNNIPIHKEANVDNAYEPDESNYKSRLTINKTWESYDNNNQNPLNIEFNGVSNYSFKLKRYAPRIREKSLFKIDTGLGNNGIPSVTLNDEFKDSDFNIEVKHDFSSVKYAQITVSRATGSSNEEALPFTLQQSVDGANFSAVPTDDIIETCEIPAGEDSVIVYAPSANEEGRSYQFRAVESGNTGNTPTAVSELCHLAVLSFTKPAYSSGTIKDPIEVLIKIMDNTKQVIIEGLAIYAQSGVPYTYVVDEIDMNAFHRKDEKAQNKPITPIYEDEENEKGKVIGGRAEFTLDNQLKYFNLRLNKIFGAEYDYKNNGTSVKKYENLKREDYKLYFNTENPEFINRLRFRLQRKTEVEDQWTDYSRLIVNQSQETPSIVKNNDGTTTITAKLNTDGKGSGPEGQYYFDFTYLPYETVDGKRYQYRIVEENGSVGEHVKIYYPSNNYPSNNSGLPAEGAAVLSDEEDMQFALERAEAKENGDPLNYSVVSTYTAENLNYSTKTYTVSSDLYTIPNEDKLNSRFALKISDLPTVDTKEVENAQGEIVTETVHYVYKISQVSGVQNAAISTEKNNNGSINLIVRADSNEKYFDNNYPQQIKPLDFSNDRRTIRYDT